DFGIIGIMILRKNVMGYVIIKISQNMANKPVRMIQIIGNCQLMFQPIIGQLSVFIRKRKSFSGNACSGSKTKSAKILATKICIIHAPKASLKETTKNKTGRAI